jgi:hypothetical protein
MCVCEEGHTGAVNLALHHGQALSFESGKPVGYSHDWHEGGREQLRSKWSAFWILSSTRESGSTVYACAVPVHLPGPLERARLRRMHFALSKMPGRGPTTMRPLWAREDTAAPARHRSR